MTISAGSPGRRRRRYTDQFKSEVVEACRRPGVSMAAVALANGLNANLLRRWVVLAPAAGTDSQIAPPVQLAPPASVAETGAFVPVQLQPGTDSADIRVEINHHGTMVNVSWPVSAAGDCAAWLREVLR